MPIEVTGYLAEDGSFFKHKPQADYYEARLQLLNLMSNTVGLSFIPSNEFDELLDFIDHQAAEVQAYTSAAIALGKYNAKYDLKEPPKDEDKDSAS